MNRVWLLIVGFPLLVFGCDSPSKDMAENSSALIFSSSWKGSKAYGEAGGLYVFESDEPGYVGVLDLKKRFRLIGKLEGSDLFHGVSLMRKKISRSGASSDGMKTVFKIVLTRKDDSCLAYWDIMSSQKNDSESPIYIAVFPTGGVFQVSDMDELISLARKQSPH